MAQADLSEWIGKTRTQHGRLGEEVAQMLHATLSGAGSSDGSALPKSGEVMPPLWHWCAFTPKVPMAALAEDGHPARGDFLPPVDLPRRMWAGGTVCFHHPLHVQAALVQVSTISAVEQKSESMTFVTVEHEIHEGDRQAITETQRIVYLEIPERFIPPTPRPVLEAPDFEVRVPMSEALLFRYSAATFNAHRIHYDLNYAQAVEKYPGLVVHGPLQATLLLAAAIDHAGRGPARFNYRGVHPMFHDDDLHLFGKADGEESMALCTGVPGGHQGMQATVEWELGR